MRLIILVLLTIPCVALAGPQSAGKGFVVEYREDGGARVTVGGVPVIRASSIQLHAPDWKQGYYSSNNSPRKVETSDDGRAIVVRHAADKHVKFAATETYRIVGDDQVEITLSGRLDTDVPANIEWAIGYVNAFALYGGGYGTGEILSSVSPRGPKQSDEPAVIGGATSITLNSRAGTIMCTVAGDGPKLTLLDGRLAAQRWWASESPTFWLGCVNVPVKPNESFELRAVLTIKPARPSGPAEPLTQDVQLQRLARAYDPPERPLRVIPTPRRMMLHEGQRIALPPEALISAPAKAAPAGALLSRQLNERFRLKTRASDESAMFKDDDPEIELSLGSADQIRPEGYTIRCNTDGIDIRATDEAGFRYAVQTLLQLARPMPDGSGAYVPACEIDDGPSLAFRGVHLFPGKDSLEFHRRLIENVIARYKFNHVVLECEYTQWDSARGIWVDFSIPKEQIKQYVKMLRDNGVEPIPLVQSLGHSGWLFKNGQNLDIAEDPETPVAYDATNPKTYELIDRVYEEALELFGPIKYFHIGHDEVTLFGRYPNRETSKQWGTSKLLLHDIDHWRQFFDPRGIKLMMWGDMLLAREEIKDGAAFSGSLEEARSRRADLAKDVAICDWHYDDTLKPDQYPSLTIFKDAGVARTIASTWFKPMNIYGFAEAARRDGAWGLLQTTWAGYNLDEGALDREFKQFSAYILAAEYAWSATSPPPDELPWRADEVLVRSLDPRGEPSSPQKGFITTLPGTAPRKDAFGAVERVDGYTFNLGHQKTQLAGALAPGEQPLPRSVTIKLNAPARQLVFLHATTFPAERGEVVGQYEIRYTDGSTEHIPLKYGQNIRALDDAAMAREAMASLVKKDDIGLTVAARVFVWTNPRPDKSIERITFSTDHPYASPVLLALTGIGGAAK